MYEVRREALLQLPPRRQGWRRAHGVHRHALIALLLASCGRIGFDARDDGDDGGDGGDDGGFAISLELPAGGQFRDLAVSPVDDTWYVLSQYGGGLFRSTNQGGAWTRCAFVDANAIEAASNGDLFASGAKVWRSTDRCLTWLDTGAPSAALDIGIAGASTYSLGDNALWVFGGGTTWTQVPTALDGAYYTAFAGHSSGLRIAGSYDLSIAVSPDGVAWTQETVGLPSPTIVDISASPARSYVACGARGGSNGGVACSDDAGATWITCYNAGGTALAMDPTDVDHVVYAAYDQLGETTDAFGVFTPGLRESGGMDDAIVRDLQYTAAGTLIAATDRGVFAATGRPIMWQPKLDGLHAWTVWDIMRDGEDVLIATDAGMLRSQAGAPFTLSTTGITANTGVGRLAVTPSGMVIAPGRAIWGSVDRGTTWSELDSLDFADGYHANVAHLIGDRLFVGTQGGNLHRADPPYTSWAVLLPIVGRPPIYELASAGNGLFFATATGVYQSSDGGSTATLAPASTSSCGGLRVLPDGGVAAACDDGVWFSDPARTSWTRVLVDVAVFEVILAGADRIIALGFEDGTFVTADRGATWTPVNQGAVRVDSGFYDDATGELVLGTYGFGLVRVALP